MDANITIEIERDPAGYSPGTYGYIIRREDPAGDSLMWTDGGHASEEHAKECAQRRVREIRAMFA